MAQEFSFSYTLRLPDDPVESAAQHAKVAAAVQAFVAAVGLDGARTHVAIREVRADRGRRRKPRLAPVPDAAA